MLIPIFAVLYNSCLEISAKKNVIHIKIMTTAGWHNNAQSFYTPWVENSNRTEPNRGKKIHEEKK